MKLGYYPGCSLHATSREFDESLRAVSGPLETELEEVEDWACCGSSSAHATNHLLSVALPARTLALAEKQGMEHLLAPCAACYSRLAGARHQVREDAELAKRVREVLERPFDAKVEVWSILRWAREVAPALKAKVKRPLSGLKVACYYGCLLVRPAELAGGEDPEDPRAMEDLVTAAGGAPVAWNRRLDCCGAGFSLSRKGSVVRLGTAILQDAKANGADVVVVGCPMCHSNLDFRQKAMSRRLPEPLDLPVVFLTQLVGMALGIEPETLGLGRHFVSTDGFVTKAMNPPPPPEPKAKPTPPKPAPTKPTPDSGPAPDAPKPDAEEARKPAAEEAGKETA